jgi:hypothetical protein
MSKRPTKTDKSKSETIINLLPQSQGNATLGVSRSDTLWSGVRPDAAPLDARTEHRIEMVKGPRAKKRTAKKGKGGRNAGYDWREGLEFLEQELNKRGDPLDPADAAPGWRSKRNAEILVQSHIEKLEKRKPSLSQVRHHVTPFIKDWRKKNRMAGN